MSDSVRPHRRQPIRLHRPWDSPGKNTGVGCHFLLQCMKGKSESEVTQSCPTPSDPMDCSLPGSSVHGIFQARVLEWGAVAFSKKRTHQPKTEAQRVTTGRILPKWNSLIHPLRDSDWKPSWGNSGVLFERSNVRCCYVPGIPLQDTYARDVKKKCKCTQYLNI